MTYFALVARVMVATGTAVCVTLASAMAQQIAGHRAVYDASLVRGDKARVIDIAGRMVFELRDACQGWDVTQRYVLKFFDNEGGARSVESQYQGWEDKAGGAYRFKVRNFGHSVGEKELKGFANVRRGGDGGNAVCSAPEATEFALPANTFFPVGHNRSLVARAAPAGAWKRRWPGCHRPTARSNWLSTRPMIPALCRNMKCPCANMQMASPA